MAKKSPINIVFLAVILSVIAGGLTAYAVVEYKAVKGPSDEELIKEFYDVETLTMVSPHHIRKHMGDETFILVDLRSHEEYEEAHIIGAINIPAYSTRYKSAYGEVDRIVNEFSKLPKDKEIIVYCYSIPCMTGRKIGKVLADHGIYVKHLGVGWNEWRYYWRLWNHEHEWNSTEVMDYISSGPEPGSKVKLGGAACPIEGEFGC